jgi:hypothetical protein
MQARDTRAVRGFVPLPRVNAVGECDLETASTLRANRSAIMASVVIRRPATDAPSCSAERTTFVGSMIPSLRRQRIRQFAASKPNASVSLSRILPTTIEPSSPA